MVILNNGKLTVKINEFGAELSSVVYQGTEYIWEGDPTVWSGRAPIMFPICGEQPVGGYVANGKNYRFEKRHGFARVSMFEVESANDTSATLVLKDSDATRAVYPFAFALRVTFTLCDNAVKVDYAIENPSDVPMYASVGAHEAYACPEGIENYEIVFERPETAARFLVNENGHLSGSVPFFDNTAVYQPQEKEFELDAIVTKEIKSRKVVLRKKDGGRTVTVEFPDHPFLLFWQKPGAKYLCIEPWCGIAQAADGDQRIEKFEGIQEIAAHSTLVRTHTITVG